MPKVLQYFEESSKYASIKLQVVKILKRCQKSLQQTKGLAFLLLPLALCIVLTGTLILEEVERNKIASVLPQDNPFEISKIAKYPFLRTVLGKTGVVPIASESSRITNLPVDDLSAEAVIVMDNDSKVVLFEKNADIRFPLASTTKLVTTLTALDLFDLQDTITIKEDKSEGAIVGFEKGQQFTLEDLLYAMLLPSANDAAKAIAQNYSGGETGFVEKMNQKTKEYFLQNTKFSDPSGLDDTGNHTTARDLARLSSIALTNKTVAQIVNTRQRVIYDKSGQYSYALTNLNKLLGESGVIGMKTGYTEGAGGVLVTTKIESGAVLVMVVMRSKDRFLDTQRLLNLVGGNITYVSIHP